MSKPRQIQVDRQSQTSTRGALQTSQDVHRNAGEFLLRLGRLAQFLARHGAGLSETAENLGTGEKLCALAMRFALATDSLKLRALVEDWTVFEIRAELRRCND